MGTSLVSGTGAGGVCDYSCAWHTTWCATSDLNYPVDAAEPGRCSERHCAYRRIAWFPSRHGGTVEAGDRFWGVVGCSLNCRGPYSGVASDPIPSVQPDLTALLIREVGGYHVWVATIFYAHGMVVRGRL